jgi:Peptidase family C25
MSDELIYLNGVDGVTGQYLVPPLSLPEAAAEARGRPTDGSAKGWFAKLRDSLLGHRGLPFDIHPTDLSRAGWGIVFAADTPAEVRSALEPLIAHRRGHVPAERCKSLEYRPGEALRDWLKRHGVYTGSVAPLKIPYYLTLVGGPSAIPFEFQYLLDIEYAVGRLAFDRPDQYRQYAEAVVDYETAGTPPTEREVVFWGTRHPGDRATQMSADCLIGPLFEGVPAGDGQEGEPPITTVSQFRSRFSRAADATHANLSEIMHTARPAVLLTASHGMGWPKGHENQLAAQGALLCQDWTGFGAVQPSQYLAAADIADDARLHGMVAFHFACYGAGTPAVDNFLNDRGRGPIPIAEQPFIAALPQRLLSHPQGGALAVIGHIERAWGYSIRPPGVGPQLVPFRNFLGRLLAGEPVGHAMQDFSQKYAALAAQLVDMLDDTRPDNRPSDAELARIWIERNDAQNYVVLGDPATRLRVDAMK